MKSTKKIPVLLVGLLLLFFISNCKKQESPAPSDINGTSNPTVPPNPYNPPAVTFNAPVQGFVVDENNNPVHNAVVSTGSQTFTTDANGAFEFKSAPFTGNFCYLKATKNGYFFGSTTVQGKSGGSFSTQLVMVSQTNKQTFTATDAKTITIANGASVDFPANAIKTLDGKPYTGTVEVATTYLNPNDANFSQVTPGGDLRAYNLQGQDVMLYSYGMVGVELRDGAGKLLQLADGKKATVTMPVPAGMQNAPATIPLWYFDENKGVWIEEGSAKLQNGSYVGTVTHFTYWNCDIPGTRAKLKGKLRDCEGDVVQDMMVRTGQTNACVDKDGNWERWVPSGIAFDLDADDYLTGTKIDLNIPVPVLANEQEHDMGIITVPCRQKVKGNVTDCDNNPFNGYVIIKTASKTFRSPVVNGKLRATVYSNGETADVFFYNATVGQLSKITITLPATGKSVDLGNLVACPPKTVTPKFSFDYNDGTGVQSVNFDNITAGNGTYYTLYDQMSFMFEGTQKTSRFGIKDPKLGPNTAANDSMYIQIPGKYFYANSITYNVSKYETAGGEVTGTFSGTMTIYPGNIPVTITNGKFTVLRLPDEQ
ncbi:MAG: carboxypeptidase-like regulatory domain-containing protein [Bacteroidota bacterium]